MTETPKPTAILIATSVLVITFSLFLVSAAIAAFAATWDPCSLISGVILLPLPAALAIQQYRGAFRHNRSASTMTAILLFLFGGFAAFASVTTFGEILVGGGELPWLGLLIPMLSVSVVGIVGGWLNLNWRTKLPLVADATVSRCFSLRELLVATAAVCFMTALTSTHTLQCALC